MPKQQKRKSFSEILDEAAQGPRSSLKALIEIRYHHQESFAQSLDVIFDPGTLEKFEQDEPRALQTMLDRIRVSEALSLLDKLWEGCGLFSSNAWKRLIFF